MCNIQYTNQVSGSRSGFMNRLVFEALWCELNKIVMRDLWSVKIVPNIPCQRNVGNLTTVARSQQQCNNITKPLCTRKCIRTFKSVADLIQQSIECNLRLSHSILTYFWLLAPVLLSIECTSQWNRALRRSSRCVT